jgi:hypothetical protein
MGFFLSILYFITYYLTPAALFGPLAAAHIEVILAILICFFSLISLPKAFIFRTPQSLALIGLAAATVLSVVVGQRWAGGALHAFLDFIPNAFGFFLICLHCNTKKRLQIIVLMLLLVCLFVIGRGSADLLPGNPESSVQKADTSDGFDTALWEIEHPYLFTMRNETGGWIFRIRGLGLIHDPNDFGQLTVCVVPLVFIFWRSKKLLRNLFCVVVPVCVLLFGVYLTHSRGALLALLAMGVIAGRRRIGTVPSVVLAGVLFVALMALNFTGGRAISAEAGSDRTDLWGGGLQVLKAHPLFGVGMGYLPNYLGLTAHNSLVVCAAELGLFGLYFWCLFLLPTVTDAWAVSSPARLSEGSPRVPDEALLPYQIKKLEDLDKAEVSRLGTLVLLSLTGFLVAGWFLSRAYVMTLFILGGMAEVVFEMALERQMLAARLRLGRVLAYAGGLAAVLIALMYILLRIVNLTH